MIIAKNYIEVAFSMEDAEMLRVPIEDALKREDTVIIDFEGIRFFTTLFFNNSICKYVLTLGEEEYQKKIKVVGLTDVGLDTYQHSFDNAVALSKDRSRTLTMESNSNDDLDEE